MKKRMTALAGTLLFGLLSGLGAVSAASAGMAGGLDPAFGTGGQVTTSEIGNVTALGLNSAGGIFALPARVNNVGHAEFTPAGKPGASITLAAITASTHVSNGTFLHSE